MKSVKLLLKLGVAGLGALGLWMILGTQAVGHHAFSAEFDPNRPVLLRGPIVRVEWVNPHTWIHLEVTNDDDSTTVWMVEGGTPNTLLRRGLSRDTICLLYTSPSPRDGLLSRMPSSA